MSAARRCDLHLLPLETLAGRSATILFPDGWYGRPHDTVFAISGIDVARDPVNIAVDEFGKLLVERDCAVITIPSKLLAIRIGTGFTRCFGGETGHYASGFISFVLDKALDSPLIGLHFFMSGSE